MFIISILGIIQEGGKFVVGHPEMWVLLEASYKTGFSTPIQGCLLLGWKIDGKSCFA